MDADQTPAETPPTTESRADIAALIAVWVLPLVGGFLKLLQPGWALVLALMLSPLLIGVYAAGVVVFSRTFRLHSPIRARWGTVPRRYHAIAWGWSVTLFALPLVVADSDGMTDYSVLTNLLGYTHPPDWYWSAYLPVLWALAIATLALTIAAWVMFGTDRRPAEPGDEVSTVDAHVADADADAPEPADDDAIPPSAADDDAIPPSADHSAALTGLGAITAADGVLVGVAGLVSLGIGWVDLLAWLPASVWALALGWRVLRRAISGPQRIRSATGTLPRRYDVLLWVWGSTVPLPALVILLTRFTDLMGQSYVDLMLLLVSLLPSVIATLVLWRMHQNDLGRAS